MGNSPLYLGIKLRTKNGWIGSFDAWNADALSHLGLTMGALSPSAWTFDVRSDPYLVPKIARKGHECLGSVNASSVVINTNEKIEFCHIFYIDTTGHKYGIKPPHCNHELWYQMGNEEWKRFSKRKTVYHEIPISDSIKIEAKDANGRTKSATVFLNYKAEY